MYNSFETSEFEDVRAEPSRMKTTAWGILAVFLVCALVVATVSVNKRNGALSTKSAALVMKKGEPLFVGESLDATRTRLRKELVAYNEDPEMVDTWINELRLARMMKPTYERVTVGADVAVVNNGWSSNYGGGGGGPFNFDLPHGAHFITKVCVRHGAFVDKIQVWWTNGATHSAGGNGGSQSCWDTGYPHTLSCILRVDVRSGAYVDSLKFYSMTAYTRISGQFGGNGGGAATVEGFQNCLVGIRGRSGAYVDQIAFRFA